MSLEGDGMPEVVLGEEVVNGKGEKSDDEEGQEGKHSIHCLMLTLEL